MTDALLYWGLGLLALSVLLVFAEVFLPSAGVISAVSLTLAVAGLACLFRFDWRWGLAGVLALLVLVPAAIFGAANIFPSTPLGRMIIHAPLASDGPPPGPTEMETLIDSEAEAATDLRPGGFIRVGGKRIAAMSEVAFVPAGARVRVVGADGIQVRVRPLA